MIKGPAEVAEPVKYDTGVGVLLKKIIREE
jgi:hypothetical protein